MSFTSREYGLLILTALLPMVAVAQQPADAPAVTWDTLDARMQWEAKQGFSGVLLVVRDGRIVLHQGFGLAQRDRNLAMQPDTILAIGSTPIDFTKASILLLSEAGKLNLDDSITKHLKNVPDDKKSMTILHLMTGRSGLPDFHDIPSDRDKDHSWIDRDEAVRRILGSKLLFAPGKGREHSHSGFGLLAAIVELVSGQSYQEFVKANLFKPAGMQDTGFFGEKYDANRMAIGYGPRKDGEINAPPYWGKTSWLVMGSGGMVSTARDIWLWTQALHTGKLLKPESLKVYTQGGEGMLVGGDMYGFEIMYAGNAQHFMVVMSNSGSPRRMPVLRKLGLALSNLVLNRKPARYVLGIQMAVEDDGVRLAQVVPGGPGAKAGLQEGDKLLSANGKPFGDNPGKVFGELLQNGNDIALEIERNGEKKQVTIKPAPAPR